MSSTDTATAGTPDGPEAAGPALERLLALARGPLGPRVELDLGTDRGPLAELAALLGRTNGFFAFHGGIQVYRVGAGGLGPELLDWNGADTWKSGYQGLADPVFCFGQDLFGVQFGILDGTRVVSFDPETAATADLGDSLEDWAAWLLADPDAHGAHSFAHAYAQANGPLPVDRRLIPRQPFALGGGRTHDNLRPEDAATAMRLRGPLAHAARATHAARAAHGLPGGSRTGPTAE
ncbi:SMI1/KNR4 family protein [Kitasatospora cineracea]|uniref:SMI1/KNR4 family protein n=1 Tax=Kitasatospora cineracea TaxID=88074 RepID=UPI003449588B